MPASPGRSPPLTCVNATPAGTTRHNRPPGMIALMPIPA